MRLRRLGLIMLLTGAAALAQGGYGSPPPPPQPAQPPGYGMTPQPPRPAAAPRPAQAPQPPRPARPPLERALGGPEGTWWRLPQMAQRLGLTADQQKKMDDVFQQARLRLIDLNAVVQKEEVVMEPLMATEQPDEARIVAQIDKVAQARAELEKANARMLLGIRRVLTADQWEKLKADPGGPAPFAAGASPAVFRVGEGVTPPVLISKVEPQYTEEARQAKFQGTVVLYVEVGPDGRATNIKVQRSLGMGLDEKAIEAVKQWRFAPGMKDGRPVVVAATLEVNFRPL
jgi:TonB family protein